MILKGANIYSLIGVEGEFRFASEFTHYQPTDYPSWQAFYFKHFGKGSIEKKSLPLKLKIKRKDQKQDINIIEFVDGQKFSSEFFSDNDHLILVAIVDLSEHERVIIPCF